MQWLHMSVYIAIMKVVPKIRTLRVQCALYHITVSDLCVGGKPHKARIPIRYSAASRTSSQI